MRVPFRVLAGLLVLASATAEAQWRTSVLPVVASAPETRAQFGVAVFRTKQADDSLGTRPSSLIGNAIVTTKNQQRAFVEYDRWTAGNERRLQVLAIASKFPLPFYEYGDATDDLPWTYEPITAELNVTRSRKRGADLWRYVGLRLVATKVEEFSPSPFCDTLCYGLPIICDCGPSDGADYRLGLITVGRIKDTRDNIFAPSRGRVLDISVSAGAVALPDYGNLVDPLLRVRFDWRGYRPLPRGGVLAAQVNALTSSDRFPLDQVALVGHHSMNRGYTMGRYRAEHMVSTQLEWRSRMMGRRSRIGVAAFGGSAFLFGTGASGRPLPSGGAGFRFRLDPRTRSAVRVDYAVGKSGQSGLYVAFNEAF